MEVTPKEAVDFISKRAPFMLKEQKEHAPILFIFGKEKTEIALLEGIEPETKNKAMRMLGAETARISPYCIAFVSEAWMKRLDMEELGKMKIEKSVRDMEGKEECLAIAAKNIMGEEVGATIPFSRIGGEIILGETTYSEAIKCYLLDEFWYGVKEGSGL